MGKVTGQLPQEKRSKVRDQVAHAVDAWFDAAYVGGDYPRNDFADAWPGFTTGAQAEAQGDKALMSNQDIGADIAGVEATARKVTVDVLAVKGKPVGRDRAVRAEVPHRRRRPAQGRGPRPAVPHAGGRRLAHLRLRRDEGTVGLMTRLRWVRRLVTLAAVLAVAARRRPRLRGQADPDGAGEDQPGHRGRLPVGPRQGHRLDPGRRLGRPARRGHDPGPRRRPPAGRDEPAHRRRDRHRRAARLVGADPRLRLQQDQRRPLLRRPAGARRRGRRPGRHPARLRVRHAGSSSSRP